MRHRIDERWALRMQLAAIIGAEPFASFVELRFKRTSGSWGQDFVPVLEVERAAASAKNRSPFGDVYAGCAPRTERHGAKAAIARVWCLWADCDPQQAVERLRAFRPLPSIVVRSGSTLPSGAYKLHAYWPLREPLVPDDADVALTSLASAIGADRASSDSARVLRPVGTLNHKDKHQPPRPVECVRVELETFTVSQVVGSPSSVPQLELAVERGPVSPKRGTPGTVARAVDDDVDVRSIASAEYVTRLTGRKANPGGFVRCPFHKHGQERTPSLRVSSTAAHWFCHADGCRRGGGFLEFYAALTGRAIPASGAQFVRFVYEAKAALLRESA